LTGIDGAITLRPEARPHPVDRAVPDLLASLEAEFFVEWQVPPSGGSCSPEK
jgi:hypothetical protein